MPQVLAPYPNIVLALRQLLTSLAACGTAEPSDWNGDPAFLRIRVYGGGADRVTDRPRFDIDALTDDEQASDDLAARVLQVMLAAPHVLDGYVIDTLTVDTRPHQVPWGANPAIFNATAAYSATLRRT